MIAPYHFERIAAVILGSAPQEPSNGVDWYDCDGLPVVSAAFVDDSFVRAHNTIIEIGADDRVHYAIVVGDDVRRLVFR